MINVEDAKTLYDKERENFLATFDEKHPETVILIDTEIKTAIESLKREANIWLINTSVYSSPFDEMESRDFQYVGERITMYLDYLGFDAYIHWDEREGAYCVRFKW
jgi:hypothetical protein